MPSLLTVAERGLDAFADQRVAYGAILVPHDFALGIPRQPRLVSDAEIRVVLGLNRDLEQLPAARMDALALKFERATDIYVV